MYASLVYACITILYYGFVIGYNSYFLAENLCVSGRLDSGIYCNFL